MNRCDMRVGLLKLTVLGLAMCGFVSAAQSEEVPQPAKPGLVYMWLFDEGVAGHQFSTEYDTDTTWKQEYKTNFYQDTFKGNFRYAEGVSRAACKFDGLTTRIVRTAIKVPNLSGGFTIEAWIAPHATSQAAIMSQEKDYKEGFIFGLFEGRLGIQMAMAGGEWLECRSDVAVPSLKWSHVAVTFDPAAGVKLYLNGEQVGEAPSIKGSMTAARTDDLLIGMSARKDLNDVNRIQAASRGFFISGFRLGQTPLSQEKKPVYTHMAFDGLMDEVKLYAQPLSAQDILDVFEEHTPRVTEPLTRRLRPIGPAVANPRFGASYGRLSSSDEYESVQRIGGFADVLVRFDLAPVRLMFARENTYIPVWITENDKMMGDQSVEINGVNGWYEVMMDKQTRYSHVRILENNDARVVIHWRYALCDRFYDIARPDEVTEWGDWADEYFTIYPDAVAARHWVYWTSTFGKDYLQFQESILHPQPGDRPEDLLETEALTLANMQGQTYTYSWKTGIPPFFPQPEAANIQLINMKSRYKPYIVFEPGSRIDKYIWGRRRGGETHLPSGPLTSGIPVISKGKDRDSYVAAALYGMTSGPITDLLALAKSWDSPPVLQVANPGYTSKGYDKFQRAYVIQAEDAATSPSLELVLAATQESPLVNPAFVIRNWPYPNVEIAVNGEKVSPGDGLRIGREHTFEGSKLIVWLKTEASQRTTVTLRSTGK